MDQTMHVSFTALKYILFQRTNLQRFCQIAQRLRTSYRSFLTLGEMRRPVFSPLKGIFFILLTVFTASGLYADGIKLLGGLNLSKYAASTKDENQSWSFKTGLCVGAGFEFDLSESGRIAIEIDALLIQKKGKRGEDPSLPNVERTYSLNTLCFPIMARIKFKRNLPFYLLGGSEFSLIMSHKLERRTGDQKSQADLKEATKRADFGPCLGGGVEVRIREFQTVFLELRYHFGLVNLIQEPEDLEALKAHAFLIVIGIRSF